MGLKDAVIALVALALPIWLLVEQVVWWGSSKERQAGLDSAGSRVEPPARKGTGETRGRPTFSPLPRKVA